MATSGNALFDRRCRVTIAVPVRDPKDFSSVTRDVIEINGGRTDRLDEPGLRVAFKIQKTLKKEPNQSTVVVTNLSRARRESLQVKGVRVLVEAGYRETGLQQIFSGDARTIDPIRKGPDWDTVFKLGDGERAWQFARVDESFAPGTRASDVLRRLADGFGLGAGNAVKQAAKIDRVFDQGFVLAGSAWRGMEKLMRALGKEWSIQDGELQILDPYETIDAGPTILEVTPDSGLIGSPEMGTPEKKGGPALVQIKMLLAVVRPGQRFRLRSAKYDGDVRAHKVAYDGDTSGANWYTTVDATVIT